MVDIDPGATDDIIQSGGSSEGDTSDTVGSGTSGGGQDPGDVTVDPGDFGGSAPEDDDSGASPQPSGGDSGTVSGSDRSASDIAEEVQEKRTPERPEPSDEPQQSEDLTEPVEQDFGRSGTDRSGFNDPDRTNLNQLRFADEETAEQTRLVEGEVLPTERDVARRFEREIVTSGPLGREDVAVRRTDEGFESGLTQEGQGQVQRNREFQQRQAREQAVDQLIGGLAGAASVRQRRDPGPGGVRFEPTTLEQGEDVTVSQTDSGLRARITESFVAQQLDERIDTQAGEDLQRGEDYTLSREGGQLRAEPTASFESERRAQAREQAIGQIERQLEEQYGTDLDRSDIAIRTRGGGPTSQLPGGSDQMQIYGTLSAEGEETVAVANAPLRNVPVVGGLSTTGARLRQEELQTTDPFAQAFREATPTQQDVGNVTTDAVPGAQTLALTGQDIEQNINQGLRGPRRFSQSQLDALRNATLDATPGVADSDESGVGGATTAAVGLGVTGTAGATATGTAAATGTATGLSSAVASTGIGAAALGATTLGAGFVRGGTEREVRRQTVTPSTPGALSAQFASTTSELDIPEGQPVQQTEVSIPEQTFGDELGTPTGEPVSQTDVDVPAGSDVFADEVEPGDPVPTQEVGLPEQAPASDGESGGQPQDETVVPGDFPLAGRDVPADPGREYVSGERNAPVAEAQQQFRQRRERPTQPEIGPEDIADPLQEPDQPGPSIRERQRREDLNPFRRRFPTGSSAVIGFQSPAEEAQDLLEEAEQPAFSEQPLSDVGIRPDLAPSVGSDELTEVRARTDAAQQQDVRQQAETVQLQEQRQAQQTRQAQEAQRQAQETTQGFEYPRVTERGYPRIPVNVPVDIPRARPDLRLPQVPDSDNREREEGRFGVSDEVLTDFVDPLTGEVRETGADPQQEDTIPGLF